VTPKQLKRLRKKEAAARAKATRQLALAYLDFRDFFTFLPMHLASEGNHDTHVRHQLEHHDCRLCLVPKMSQRKEDERGS
jgi:hypothetical protein